MNNETFLTSIDGNSQMLDGGAMFGNAPKAMWSKWLPPDGQNRIPLACRSLLIEHNDTRILCEVGIGNFFAPKLAERFGVQSPTEHLLIKNLTEAGTSEEQIDYVILSHLHFDHAGGLLPSYEEIEEGELKLKFPKAKYVVGKEAWERANHPHHRDRASFLPLLNKLLEESNRLIIVEEDKIPNVLEDRLSFRYSYGHTPGHMHTLFKGNDRTVFFCGDLVPGSSWCHIPITMGYDRFPEQLINEKEELYQLAFPENWLLFYTHDPNIAASSLARDDRGKFSSSEAIESLIKFTI